MRKLFSFFLCVFIAGCATITKGRYQEITVNSNVSEALVVIDGVEMGYTPYKGKIRRDSKGEIKVSKPGYASGQVTMIKDKRWFAQMFGNMSLGATTGTPLFLMTYADRQKKWEENTNKSVGSGDITAPTSDGITSTFVLVLAAGAAAGLPAATLASIDSINGAMWEYSPSQYYVQLKEQGQSSLNFVNEVAIRYFSSINHSQIAIDANSGKDDGEYMNALSNLMGANANKTNGEIAKQSIHEALAKSKGDQVLFGDELIARFRE